MRKMKENSSKASESAPMETKQRDDIGVRNQTTESTKSRFPLITVIVVSIILIIIIATILFPSFSN